ARSSLANTYPGLIPQDADIVHRVAKAVHTTNAIARSNITVLQRRKGAGLLTIEYEAGTRSRAHDGSQALLAAVSGSNPLSPNIVPGTIMSLGPARTKTTLTGRYVSRVSAVVPPNPAQQGAGNADAAQKLATTYASLLPEDSKVIAFVARHANLPQANVRNNLTVTNDQNSAVLRVRFNSKKAGPAAAA